MKKFAKLFPVFALIMGVSMAVATASPKVFANTKKANQSGMWIDITNKVQGRDYNCVGQDPVCTQLFDSSNNPISGTAVRGVYTPL